MRQVKDDPINQQGVLKVTKFKILAAVAAIVFVGCVLATDSYSQQYPNTATQAQTVQAQPVQSSVALLDVGKIFKQNERFKVLKLRLKDELQRADAKLKLQRDSIIQKARALKGDELKIGSQDYKQLEAEVAKRQADLQVDVQIMKKDLMTKEAKIYHGVYIEIRQEVEAIANAYGLAVVIQFNGDPVNPESPEQIMREISKPIVWHNPSLDITNHVLQRLSHRSAGSASSNTRQGIPQQPRR